MPEYQIWYIGKREIEIEIGSRKIQVYVNVHFIFLSPPPRGDWI